MNDIKIWKSNENFSFKVMENQTIKDEACPNSLFNGTIIRKCSWYNVDVNHSDIEAIKVYDNCLFEKCIFSHTDIHSDYFADTKFINVDFSESSIADCTFKNCIFLYCIFDDSNMRESSFESCQLENCSLLHGSYLLNQFINCSFKKMTFKNVFYYTTMITCVFLDVKFEVYLLGYTYGLTSENLRELNYIYMGKESEKKYEELYFKINQVYLERHMYINSGILFLMDDNISKIKAIKECYLFIGRYIKNNYLIKSEQMMFLFRITELLFDSNVLPPIMLWQIIRIINQIKLIQDNESQEKILDSLLTIQSKLLTRYYSFVDYISEKL